MSAQVPDPAGPGDPNASHRPTAGPSWHRDPFGRRAWRWWDGERWTAYAANDAVEWDPAPVESPVPPQPDAVGTVPLAIVGYALGVGLSFAVVATLRAAGYPGGAPLALAWSSIALWSGLVAACVVAVRRHGHRSVRRDLGLRFRWADVGFGLAGSLAARALALSAASPIPSPTNRLRDIREDAFTSPRGLGTWLLVAAVVCVGAPVVEELFFRGLLQPRLVERLGPVVGVGTTAVLFGAAHLIAWTGPYTFVYAWAVAASGITLGVMRHHTGRLGPGIFAHMFFNAQALLVLWLV